ncbi:hypothetical protein [Gloeobacter violaceus]|uniref:hypothetical protein n=1 Tax=Gloeobacter violaceus TaxID=33072 RepID=UPI0013E8A704|nr:hypothetical protein [Gloeobacter violaceus]
MKNAKDSNLLLQLQCSLLGTVLAAGGLLFSGIARAQADALVETLITFDPTAGELPEGVTVDNCANVYVGVVSTG